VVIAVLAFILFSQQVNAIVEEYFSSGDVGNAADSLTDLDAPVATMGHYFVKRLLTLALDRKDKEREMASSLLSNLYAEVRGFVGLCCRAGSRWDSSTGLSAEVSAQVC
jgi:hypothetical protein